MGALCGKAGPTPAEIEAEKRAKKLASKLTDNSKADNSVIKLLLLGAGESGKSTFFKQLVSLYSPKDEKEQQEQKRYVGVIHSNIIVNAQALATASNDFGEPTTPDGNRNGSWHHLESLVCMYAIITDLCLIFHT